MVGCLTKNWDLKAFVLGEVQLVLPGFKLGGLGCLARCITTQLPGPVMVNRCGVIRDFRAFVLGWGFTCDPGTG